MSDLQLIIKIRDDFLVWEFKNEELPNLMKHLHLIVNKVLLSCYSKKISK